MNKSALLVIDYQHDLVHPDGIIASKIGNDRLVRAQALAPEIQKMIDRFAEMGQIVVSVQADYNIEHYIGHFKQKRSTKNYANTALVGTKGHDLYEVQLPNKALYVVKHYFDGFYETDLQSQLQENGIEKVYVCGVNTDACVIHTAISAAWRGYHTFVIEDLTETISSNKEQAIEYLAKVVDVERIKSSEVLLN